MLAPEVPNRPMNLKALSMSGFMLLVSPAISGQAQKIDLANLTCKQFTTLPKDTMWTVTAWLDGYYTDDEDPTLVEIEKLKAKAEQLLSFCTDNPKASLLAVAQDVLAK
jgi:HdeA/HdeB family